MDNSTRVEGGNLLKEVAWWHDCPWIILNMHVEVCGRAATIVGATTSHSTSWGASSHQLILQSEERTFEWEPKDRATYYDQNGRTLADFQESNMLQGSIEREGDAICLRHAEGVIPLFAQTRGFIRYNSGWQHGMLFPKYERIPHWSCPQITYTRAGILVNAKGMLFVAEQYPYTHGMKYDFHEGQHVKISRLLLPTASSDADVFLGLR